MRLEIPYDPLPKQLLFHQATNRFRVYAGGMGSGKTLCGAYEAIANCLEYQKNLGLVGRATYPELRDTTRKEVLEFPVVVDGKEYTLVNSPLVKSFNKAENTLELVNGSVMLFRALQDSFDKVKSLNLGWFWIDELTEVPEEMWLALVGRLRRKGAYHRGWGTTNPEGHDWVWKRFIAQRDSDHFLVTASSEENSFLPDGYVDSLKRQYPEEWVKRYVYGSFDTFEGLVYKEFFDREPHVVRPFVVPEHWFRFVGIDHGYRNPAAVLWGAVSPKGEVFIYDEFYASGKLVSEVAEIIKTKTGEQNVKLYLIDPSTRNRNGVSGRSVIDEFNECGVYVTPANNDVRAGINRVSEYLKISGKEPRLKIFQNCIYLRTELQTYRWKDLKPGAVHDAPEKPRKKDDHLVDALRYMIIYIYDTPQVKEKQKFDYKEILSRFKGSSSSNWKAA